jgi:hypothetical protein
MAQQQQQQQQQHHHQQQQQRKKKVEWSSNLSSSEPQPTENRSPMWDTESGETKKVGGGGGIVPLL